VTDETHVARNGKLDLGHVHQLLRLLAEAREIPAGRPEREQLLVSGAARIVDATVGASILDLDGPAEGGLGRAGSGFGPLIRAMMRITPPEPGATITATWSEILTDPRWYGARHLEPHLRRARFADALFSSVRLRAPSHLHGLVLYREPEHAPFREEDRNLLHVFHAGCEGLLHPPLDDGDGDEATRARLSPRLRQTLELVLNGLCDKEIAERLGISRYTVNQYTKTIYRLYSVSSRIQLLARMLVQPQALRSLIIGRDIGSTAL
jgi:DNA-binding CsgD family transcriptional regulator